MNEKDYVIKVLIPTELLDVIENVDLNVYFKEKANCKKFTDKEGVKYITGYKQEGTSHDKQED